MNLDIKTILTGIEETKDISTLIKILREIKSDEPLKTEPLTHPFYGPKLKELETLLVENSFDIENLKLYTKLLFYPAMDYPTCLKACAKILRNNPRDPETYLYTGHIFLNNLFFNPANTIFNAGLFIDSANAEIHCGFHYALSSLHSRKDPPNLKMSLYQLEQGQTPHTSASCRLRQISPEIIFKEL